MYDRGMARVKKPQWVAVLDALNSLGGVATLTQLSQETLDKGVEWKTKTPAASIRRIVQLRPEFHRVKAGLYCIVERAAEVDAKYDLPEKGEVSEASKERNHTYYQGLLVETGHCLGHKTFVPAMDKNRDFLGKPLFKASDMTKLPEVDSSNFGYPHLMRQAKTIDVIWFNHRQMPEEMFEIELSTDMNRSLIKFNELRDFHAKLSIVAPGWRHAQFDSTIAFDAFRGIRGRVKFLRFEDVERKHIAAADRW